MPPAWPKVAIGRCEAGCAGRCSCCANCGTRVVRARQWRHPVLPGELGRSREEVGPPSGEGGRVEAPDGLGPKRRAQPAELARSRPARVVASVALRLVADEEGDVVLRAHRAKLLLREDEAAHRRVRHEVRLLDDHAVCERPSRQRRAGVDGPIAAPATLVLAQAARNRSVGALALQIAGLAVGVEALAADLPVAQTSARPSARTPAAARSRRRRTRRPSPRAAAPARGSCRSRR